MDKSITTNTKKLKLTFDISVLTRGYWKDTSRSGIFVVALNILKQLLNNTDIDLTLTCDPFKFYYVMHVLNNEFSEETLGYLIYFFEKACAISCYMLGVNPFDQSGVELYKNNMFELLGKPKGKH